MALCSLVIIRMTLCSVVILRMTLCGSARIVRYRYSMANFSAQTSAANFRELIEDKLDKRRKNLLGPPSGKQMVIFVDDINMPVLEECVLI